MSRELWNANLVFSYGHLSPTAIRGYHYWAIPYVRMMRVSPWAEKFMYPFVMARSYEIAYQLGYTDKPHYFGKLVRLVVEPAFYLIGLFVSEQDPFALYTKEEIASLERD